MKPWVRRQRIVAVVFLACLALGCARSPEAQAVAAVERLGGQVTFTGAGDSRHATSVDLSRSRVSDDDLAMLRALAQIESLNLSGTSIDDAGLAELGRQAQLKKLNLNLTRISDAGLAHLANIEHLEELYCIETGLTDAAIAPLSKLNSLKRLALFRTQLSPAAVARLRRALPQTQIQIEPVRRSAP